MSGRPHPRGANAEQLAARFLIDKGLALIEHNYRCRAGEIDLVMRDAGTTVFVEVRQRSSDRFGSAAESITASKRSRLITAAHHYLATTRDNRPCRFDAVLLSGSDTPSLEWIRDAFGA